MFMSCDFYSQSEMVRLNPVGVGNDVVISDACVCLVRVWLFLTPWTVARQAPLFMGFSRQEYWSGWPFAPPGVPPDLGI